MLKRQSKLAGKISPYLGVITTIKFSWGLYIRSTTFCFISLLYELLSPIVKIDLYISIPSWTRCGRGKGGGEGLDE